MLLHFHTCGIYDDLRSTTIHGVLFLNGWLRLLALLRRMYCKKASLMIVNITDLVMVVGHLCDRNYLLVYLQR